MGRNNMDRIELDEPVIAVDAVAKKLGCCPTTVHRYARRGRLKKVRIGRRDWITESSLNALSWYPEKP